MFAKAGKKVCESTKDPRASALDIWYCDIVANLKCGSNYYLVHRKLWELFVLLCCLIMTPADRAAGLMLRSPRGVFTVRNDDRQHWSYPFSYVSNVTDMVISRRCRGGCYCYLTWS